MSPNKDTTPISTEPDTSAIVKGIKRIHDSVEYLGHALLILLCFLAMGRETVSPITAFFFSMVLAPVAIGAGKLVEHAFSNKRKQ